jgi:DNA processing protein
MQFPINTLKKTDFPPLLHEIPDAPKQLYIRGALPPKNYMYLCIVGSRRTTHYGSRVLHQLVEGLAEYPVAIVSGLAWGTDANAHKAALDVGLPTVAILPSGLDDTVMYPRMNRPLAAQILKRGGALISENPHHFKAMLHSFAQRNRIVAGMSTCTLIIEAGAQSGTLITARLALDYNREVLVVPHELGHVTGIGCNELLHQGATLVRSATDIAEALGFKPETPVQRTLPTDLSFAETAVLETLDDALFRDDIIVEAGLSAQEANIALSSLLLRGLIVERLGKIERA